MKNINFIQKSAFLAFILLFTVIGCEKKYPEEAIIDKAKAKTNFILDSLRMEQDVIIEKPEINEEFFDENAGQYVINYNIETGLDSASIVNAEASMFIMSNNNEWRYNFVFDETYTGIIK